MMNSFSYYVFCPKIIADKQDWSLPFCDYESYFFIFNEEQSIRLFGSKNNAGKEFVVWKIYSCNDELISTIEFGKFFSDCNPEIHEFLESNSDLLGWSSRKINIILNLLFIRRGSVITGIKGDDGWGDLKNLFGVLRETDIDYLVLRKYEMLPFGYLDGDHDIDVLCSSLLEMRLVTGAKKRNIGISSYYLVVGGIKIDFDIRFVGDGYFDASWERKCLDNRTFNQYNVSIMDDDNQLFTIIYHVLTQKNKVSIYYKEEISRLINKIFGNSLSYVDTENEMLSLLIAYMQSNSYYYAKPLDISVVQNYSAINKLKRNVFVVSLKKNLMMRLYWHVPRFIKKHFSNKLLNYLFEMR